MAQNMVQFRSFPWKTYLTRAIGLFRVRASRKFHSQEMGQIAYESWKWEFINIGVDIPVSPKN